MGKGQKERRKGVTMPLGNFLAATGKQDWGDMDSLPTGPSSREGDDYRGYGGSRMGMSRDRDETGGKSFGDRYESRNNPDSFANYGRSERETRAPTAIPDRGPFKAFVGGVPNSFADSDLLALFKDKGCKALAAKMVVDMETGRPKGFGYVEFEDRDALVQALEHNGMEVEGRTLKVDVQENRGGGPRNSFMESEGGEDKTQGNWRSKMGAAPPPPASNDRFNRGGRPGGAFGDRFGDRSDRFGERSDRFGDRSDRFGDRSDRFGDRERSFGSGGFGGGRFPRDERSSGSAPSGERPRVQLKTAALLEVLGGQKAPEAQEGTKTDDVDATAEELKKSNPFGAARPVDTAAKEAAIEKKLEEMRRSSEHKEAPSETFRGRRDFESGAFGRRDRDDFDRRNRDGSHDRRDSGYDKREGSFGRRDEMFGRRDRDGGFDRSRHSENRSYEHHESSRDRNIDDVKPDSAAGVRAEANDSPPSPVAPQSNTYEALGDE